VSLPVKNENGPEILKNRFALIITITALLLSSCSSTTTESFPTANNDNSTLTWESCNGSFQCATLKVPIDYNDASLGEFDIAVLRYRDKNQHDRLGSLVVNPGGPGVSGIEFALNAEFIFNPEILERYDIVGFDPRGVGQSTAIECLTATEQDALLSGDPKPDNDAEFAEAITETQSFIDECVAKVPNLAHFSTRDAAQDMEILRKSLGDEKLNYMGFSYGTYLGTLYAQGFPEKVGRFVLDGAINPSISMDQQSLVQAIGFDKALANFMTDCFQDQDCPLPPNSTPQFFTDLFAKTSNQPLTTVNKATGQTRQITEGLVVTGTAAALYDDASGWPLLQTAISQALLGDGTGFAFLADGYSGRNSDGTYKDNQNDANVIINCLDWQQFKSNEAIRLASAEFSKVAPVFGPYVAFSGITCNILNQTINRKVITTDQNSVQIRNTATPVVIIGTTQDPATPYAWSKALAAYIKGSRLITLRGEGHTGYGRGSACTDDAVDSYLITGKTPKNNLICTS
jgi:pimeloyl-ACP methyl ester carboxylesterase